MPELPEVETIAAELRPELTGRRFVGAHIAWPRTLAHPDPSALHARLVGSTIVEVGRRGKYLLFALDSGDTLIIHLRMTGRLAVSSGDAPAAGDGHVRAWFDLADGRCLVFTDARKFGRVWLVRDAAEVTGKLGPEPLARDFTAELLGERIGARRAAIKALLLDQGCVAGLGNIYADESLFCAGIHPLRPGAGLTGEEVDRLHGAIRSVLADAVGQRGTMLRDYRPPYGEEGGYREHLRVYGQTGRPCSICATPIERIRVIQRSTHFCPRCQPAALCG